MVTTNMDNQMNILWKEQVDIEQAIFLANQMLDKLNLLMIKMDKQLKRLRMEGTGGY